MSNNPWLACFYETQDSLSYIKKKLQYLFIVYIVKSWRVMITPKQNGFGLKPRARLSRAWDLTWALDIGSKKHGGFIMQIALWISSQNIVDLSLFFFGLFHPYMTKL
jgi:hypothetical protein